MRTDYIKYNDAEYVMPFLFGNDLYIPIFNELLQNEKNPIKYVYGTPQTPWAGGRLSQFNLREKSIEAHISKLRKYNITAAIPCTSQSITDEMLKIEYCNNLLDIANQYNCHIIVGSEKLYNYIKKQYPNIKMVCSILLPSIKFLDPNFKETDFYNKMLDKYEIVVVRPEWTMENIDKISEIIVDPERIEILINQYCAYNCKNAAKHYNLVELIERNEISHTEYVTRLKSFCEKEIPNYRNVTLTSSIIEKALAQGIKLLKVQGRCYSFNQLYDSMFEYVFNDKYSKEEIREKIDKISAMLIQNSNKSALTLV